MILCVTLYMCFVLLNVALADLPNPIFSEIAFIVNTTDSSNIYNIIYSTAATVNCQDFQAVLLNKKEYSPTNRVLLNFGYGCQNTTIDNVYQMNFNTTNITAIRNMETVALVKRGICNWSEKISVINRLSTTNKMNVTAALVYDNQTYQDITIQTSLYQATVSFPTYSTSLPSYRSALNMSDNDLSQSSIGVYFIPYAYGNTLKSKLNDTYDSSDSTIRTFWSITTYFPQDDSSSGFIGSIRGYFAYIVALAAVFVIGVIFLRWWKLRRLRLNNTNDLIGNNVIYLQQRVNQIDPLPVNIVNSLPVKQYEMGSTKNLNCAICLEDFTPEKGDVRMLPCGHGFCVLCIDPWLTQKSTLCPICKWDCLPPEIRQERETDNDSTYPIDMYETMYASSLVAQHDVHHADEHRDGPLSTAIEMNNSAHNQPEVEANSIPSDVSTCNSQAHEATVLHSSDVQLNENISSPSQLEPKNEQKDESLKEIHK